VKGAIADLDKITWKGRRVIILFDRNVATEASVQAARAMLAKELRGRGAQVDLFDWPDVPDSVNGIDDLLGFWKRDDVLKLLETNKRPDVTPAKMKSQADKLVELAEGVDFFHADVDLPFVSLQINGHVETWPVYSKGFKYWLGRQYYRKHEKAPSSQAVQDALNVLAGRAIHDGPKIPVHTRIAEHAGNLCLDLADEE
jgi:hypothetical protein